MESFFKAYDVEPANAMVMNSNETIKQAVMVNLGLSFVSLDTVRMEVSLGRLAILDVVGLPVVKHWHLVQMRKVQSPAAEAFSRFMLTNRHKPACFEH
jgi:DNA-binding transcriptional LysR family regulator